MSAGALGQRSGSSSNIAALNGNAPWQTSVSCTAVAPNGRKHGKVVGLPLQSHGHMARERERLCVRFNRMVTSKRVGMFVAALLSFVSLLMLINVASRVSFHFKSPKDQQMDVVAQFHFGGVAQKTKLVENLDQHQSPLKQFVRSTNERAVVEHVSDEEAPLDIISKGQVQGSSQEENKEVGTNNTLHFYPLSLPALGTKGESRSGDKLESSDAGLPSFEDRSKLLRPLVSSDPPLPQGHPCQGFTLPPPPADKKRTGPRPCPVCYLPVEKAIQQMPAANVSASPILKNLTYVVELPTAEPFQGLESSEFGGHPSLEQREQSFQIQESMHVHCGFVKGSKPGVRTGFDIDEDDRIDMDKCRQMVVASAIFGNYDQMQQPKNISQEAEQDVCFFMFIDEETERFLSKGSSDGKMKNSGLWRVVVVHNLPYSDARRNGKIPKLLLHRLFPNAQFSLWIDGKLQLVVDPYQILERFLWRGNNTFAISQHYKRLDVFEEAEANKAAGKYDNASIDSQVDFYLKEGLQPYSRLKLPFRSDVPEGCVIIREHTPITNLFTCLWFNEVDRFTSRDQLSFAIVRDKLMERVPWRLSMFLDCERRNFVVQAYHRGLLEQRNALLNTSTEHMDSTSESIVDPAVVSITDRVGATKIQHVRQTPSASSRKGTGRRKRGAGARQRVGSWRTVSRST